MTVKTYRHSTLGEASSKGGTTRSIPRRMLWDRGVTPEQVQKAFDRGYTDAAITKHTCHYANPIKQRAYFDGQELYRAEQNQRNQKNGG